MSIAGAAKYIEPPIWLHKLDPRTKIVWTGIASIIAITYLDPVPIIMLMASVIPVLILTRFPLKVLKGWFKIIGPLFVMSLVLWSLMLPAELLADPTLQLEVLFTIPVINYNIYWTSFRKGLVLAVRTVAISIPAIFLVTTTKPMELIQSLARLKLPYAFCFILGSVIRFIPTLAIEVEVIQQAQESRAMDLINVPATRKIRNSVTIFIPLLVNSLRKVKQMTAAMAIRAFKMRGKRTYAMDLSMKRRDWAFLAIFLGYYLVLYIIWPSNLVLFLTGQPLPQVW